MLSWVTSAVSGTERGTCDVSITMAQEPGISWFTLPKLCCVQKIENFEFLVPKAKVAGLVVKKTDHILVNTRYMVLQATGLSEVLSFFATDHRFFGAAHQNQKDLKMCAYEKN